MDVPHTGSGGPTEDKQNKSKVDACTSSDGIYRFQKHRSTLLNVLVIIEPFWPLCGNFGRFFRSIQEEIRGGILKIIR